MTELFSEDGKRRLRKYVYLLITGGILLIIWGINTWGRGYTYLGTISIGFICLIVGTQFLKVLRSKK